MMRRPARLFVFAFFLAAIGAILVAPAATAPAATKAKEESYQQFLAQLSKGEVKSAVLVPKQTTLHAKLKNGARYTAKYPSSDRKRLVAELHQRNVHVSFAKPKKKKKSSRIRLRYIALGVIGVGALVSAGWVLTRRRRTS